MCFLGFFGQGAYVSKILELPYSQLLHFMSEPSLSFEESIVQLEKIVRTLDDGKTSLDESLEKYEAGIRLLRRCTELLDNARRRIEVLQGVTEDGVPILKPQEKCKV